MAAAGKFDRKIQFQRASSSDDGFSSVEVWANHGDPISAAKIDVSDAERYRAESVSSQLTTRFQVRYSPFTTGVTPKDRILCEGRVYHINGIKELAGRRRVLELTTSALIDNEVQV